MFAGPAPKGLNLPRYCNGSGMREIRVGAREFECIGQTPPQDHPHIYLEIGDQDTVLCPYCSTLFRLDENLQEFEADPPASLYTLH
jgi:uncharacterized Zn-finger protein